MDKIEQAYFESARVWRYNKTNDVTAVYYKSSPADEALDTKSNLAEA